PQAIMRRYVLFTGWDDIADANDMAFMTDGIHLSKRAALMVTNLIGDFLTRPVE
ncbi:MAG: hypothetical protein ACJA0W_004015, partial [Candidatus Azotimanducaceae bacterium]